jgi:hypothetical protein
MLDGNSAALRQQEALWDEQYVLWDGQTKHLKLIVWLDRDVSKFGSKADRIQRIIDKANLQTEQPYDEHDRAYWYVYGPDSAIFALNKALARVPDCDTDIQ